MRWISPRQKNAIIQHLATLETVINRVAEDERFEQAQGWNVTSAGWQVTLCDPIWHVSSSSGEACCELL